FQIFPGECTILDLRAIKFGENLALTFFHSFGRRPINWNRVFGAGKARTIHFRLIVTGEKALRLAGGNDSRQLEGDHEKGRSTVAMGVACRYRALTHLKQSSIERPCRPHRARAVENSAAALNKRVEG